MLFAKRKTQKANYSPTAQRKARSSGRVVEEQQQGAKVPALACRVNCEKLPQRPTPPASTNDSSSTFNPSAIHLHRSICIYTYLCGCIDSKERSVSERRAMRKDYPGNGNLHKRHSDNIFLLLAIKAT